MLGEKGCLLLQTIAEIVIEPSNTNKESNDDAYNLMPNVNNQQGSGRLQLEGLVEEVRDILFNLSEFY